VQWTAAEHFYHAPTEIAAMLHKEAGHSGGSIN
jgi:hypothetical protein